ncbi:MAG: hypothetical protein HKN21_11180, partial [Candidatus Eisenbacteria bacterium]|nr:hypothetical protein [Candidatus Eisenbacteria bacterium]
MSYPVCKSATALCLALACLLAGVSSLLASPTQNPYKTRVSEAQADAVLSLAQDQNEPWSPDFFVSGIDGPVVKVLEFQGDLIVAGGFEVAGALDVNHIARWDGNAWHKMGAGFNDWVTVLAIYQGQLVAGGDFTHSGGTEVNHVARWNGTSWDPIGGGVTEEVDTNAWINAILEYQGDLYVGGNFSHAGGQPIAHIAKWDGKSWNAVGDGLNSDVQALHIHGHELIAGGAFTKNGAEDQFLLSVARLFGDTWVPIGDGFNARVNDLGSYGGKLVATGDFNFTGSTLIKYLAEWDGQDWVEIGSGLGGPGWVLEDGEKDFAKDNFIVGGNFIHGALVWNGNILVTVTPLAPIRNIVLDVKPFGDSLVFGGLFLSPASDEFRYIASLENFTWQPLLGSGGLGFNGRVRDIAEFRDEIYVVGDFTRAGGKAINHIARWDGAEWQPVGIGIGGSGHSLLVKDDVLYVGGAFEWAGRATAVGIAQWDGETWLPVGSGFNGFVRTMIDFEGTLIAGGAFTMSAGRQVFGIAQWNG